MSTEDAMLENIIEHIKGMSMELFINWYRNELIYGSGVVHKRCYGRFRLDGSGEGFVDMLPIVRKHNTIIGHLIQDPNRIGIDYAYIELLAIIQGEREHFIKKIKKELIGLLKQ